MAKPTIASLTKSLKDTAENLTEAEDNLNEANIDLNKTTDLLDHSKEEVGFQATVIADLEEEIKVIMNKGAHTLETMRGRKPPGEKGPQQEALEAAFPPDKIKKVQNLDYVPVGDVIHRMNEVLGTGGWSSNVTEIFEGGDYIIAQVMVTATVDGLASSHTQMGGKKKNTRQGSDTLVDLGHDYKGAASDALKKACQQFGVGLHLAIGEDESIPVAAPAAPEGAVELDLYNKVMGVVAEFEPDKLRLVKEWWAENGIGPKPEFDTVTEEVFEAYATFVRTLWSQPTLAEGNSGEAMSSEAVAEALDAEVVETTGDPF